MARIILLFLVFLLFPSKVFSTFSINNISPSSINSADEIITINASASGLQNSSQYFQVLWTKEGESVDYFGQTKNLTDEWFLYKSSPATTDLTSYFYAFTPVAGTWSGQIQTKIDTSDTGFKGVGNYLIKLAKYISGSPSYSNPVTIFVNVSQISDTPTPTLVVGDPTIELSIDSPHILAQNFSAKITAKNLAKNTRFYVKVRGGLEDGKLTKARTQKDNSWLSDGESWVNFPIVTTDDNGYWSGEIKSLVDEDKDAGHYKFLARLKKVDTDSFFESNLVSVKINPIVQVEHVTLPTPIITPFKISPVNVSTVAAVPQILITPEVLGTTSAKTSSISSALDLLLKHSEFSTDFVVVSGMLIAFGGLITAVVKYRGEINN